MQRPRSRGVLALLVVATCCMAPFGDAADAPALSEGVVKPFRAVTISASIREIIRKIQVEEGDRIKEGQPLVNLQSEKQQLAVERYEQMISKAQFDYNAAKRLFDQNVSSRDDALAKEVELKRLQAELSIAKAELAEREILSPLTGVVVRKFKESGESISENDPILQVMTTDQVLLLFHLEASQLPAISLGQEFAVQFPEMPNVKSLKAKVNFIDPEVDARSGLFRVRLLLDNKEGTIRPGLRVQAAFPPPPGKTAPAQS
ncbi:RND family efflux transporter MFP subunit [Roseimicrobium gellanilyticum]|uniref:RND family efflux transporter MFP subunit n=1 Tax=Roseimicrobium gellanilyticum TaxID=748857 RepID=A0A366HPG1_9BACT|nr:efflux RND transporter periplasmic adaptor subunit [Roseimicrobium gellanilyticum]RBP45386.1 RND family efflux transporter MFP subunit [Roseimicrobium gellanilyticum]